MVKGFRPGNQKLEPIYNTLQSLFRVQQSDFAF